MCRFSEIKAINASMWQFATADIGEITHMKPRVSPRIHNTAS